MCGLQQGPPLSVRPSSFGSLLPLALACSSIAADMHVLQVESALLCEERASGKVVLRCVKMQLLYFGAGPPNPVWVGDVSQKEENAWHTFIACTC